MSVLTLAKTREACSRLLSVRAQIRTLSAEADSLSDTLRPSLTRWGAVVVNDTTEVYVTAESTRTGWDAEALATLATRLGATDSDLSACRKATPVRASVRDRKPSGKGR